MMSTTRPRCRVMTQCFLALLPPLFAVSLRGDTFELKRGEGIEGTFKQATSAGAVIEVGGQSITFPLGKLRAIYFGVVARSAGGAVPSKESRGDFYVPPLAPAAQ